MKKLKFYKLSERKPKDGQEIWYIHNSPFYGTYEFEFGKVEYSYEELDEDGEFNGTSYFERPPQEGEEDYDPSLEYSLEYLFNGASMLEDDLWAPVEEIEKELFEDA